MSLFNELKRRNVIRVAVGYLVLSWLVLQVIDVLAGALELPGTFSKFIVILLAVGLIPALVFSWVFEMTPQGLKRESEIAPDETARAHTTRKLDLAIIVLLIAAIGLFGADRFLGDRGQERSPSNVTSSTPVITDASVAVLPFTNMSAQAENEYFSDGLADTLLHMLAQTPDLRVAARTSSFQFKGQQVDARDVGEQLNVATVLEGSVQRSGDRIRVIAQLIDTHTGYHLWSETFDRQLDDIFQVQDEIAGHVADALFTSLLGGGVAPASGAPDDVGGTDSVAAYEAFMQANVRLETRTTEDVQAGIQLLELAVSLDPEYGRAWARLAEVQHFRTIYGTATRSEVLEGMRTAAAQAMAVAPDLAEAQLAHAEHLVNSGATLAEIETVVLRALELNPNNVTALAWMAGVHEARLDERASLRALLAAVERDPLDVSLRRELVGAYKDNGLLQEAEAAFERVLDMDPDSVVTRRMHAGRVLDRGDVVGAVRIWRELLAENPEQLQLYMRLSFIYAHLGDRDRAVAYMTRAWEIRPDRVHDDLALMYGVLGDDEAFLRHWADFRAHTVEEDLGRLTDIDSQTAVVEEDWEVARELYLQLLRDAQDREFGSSIISLRVILAGIEHRLGDTDAAAAHMAAAMTLVDRTASLGADYPSLDLLRAVDAAHRGDAEGAARLIAGSLGDNPVFTILGDLDYFLAPPEFTESAPVQALWDELNTRRVAALAELHAAFPEPLL